MGIFVAIGVGLFVVGVWGFARWLKRGMSETDARWTSWVREVAKMVAWIASAAIVFTFVVGADQSWVSILGLLVLFSVGTAWVSNRLTMAVRRARVDNVRALFVQCGWAVSRRVSLGLKQGASVIAPTGWSEFRIGSDLMDRVLAPRTVLLAYVAGLAVLPVLFAYVFTNAIRGGSISNQRIFSLIVGYNALLVVSCITAAVVASLLVLSFLRFAQVLLVDLAAARAFRVVATWTGYGTAAGVVSAALMPVLNQLIPLSTSRGAESDLTAIVSPQLLIDIPAAGAVVGYGIGLTISVVVLCQSAKNLIIRWLLAPVIFVVVLVALGMNGIDPRGLFAVVSRSIAASRPSDSSPCNTTADQFEERLADTPWILQLLETCGPAFIVEGETFVAVTSVAVLLVALVLMTLDVWRGMKDLPESSAVRYALPSNNERKESTRPDGSSLDHQTRVVG